MVTTSFSLDRDSNVPLRDQIASRIRDRIRRGELSAGSRIPSSRELAEHLGVNRATVVESYRELKAAGWIDSGVGKGSFVTERGADPGTGTPQRFPWPPSAARNTVAAVRSCVQLARAVCHQRLFPIDEVRNAFNHAFESNGSALLDYPPPAGYKPLRAALAQRLAKRGIDPEANKILIVNGSQQGLDLAARLTLSEGGSVVTSVPSFSGALEVFRGHGHLVHGVRLDENGLDTRELADLFQRERPRLLYTIPDCHNPTGVSMSAERRSEVLSLAREYGVVVLEDDWLADLRSEAAPAPIKAADDTGHVLYLGTFSKVLIPGLRLGWLVVPRETFGSVVHLKKTTDLASNLPGQVVMHRLLESGFFDRHVQSLRSTLGELRQIANTAIERYFPADLRPLANHDGMVLWVPLPSNIDVPRLLHQAALNGVEISGGAPFNPTGQPLSGIRICYASAEAEPLARALKDLGEVLRRELDSRPAPTEPPLV